MVYGGRNANRSVLKIHLKGCGKACFMNLSKQINYADIESSFRFGAEKGSPIW